MKNLWPAMIGRLLGLLTIAALLGWSVGYPALTALIASLGCLIWQLLHLYRLESWIRSGAPPEQPPELWPPLSNPLWKRVYQSFFRLRRRNRKRKRKFRQVLEQFQSAAAALPDAVVVLNHDDTILWCNERSQRLLGLRPHQDTGLKISELVRHPTFIHFLTRQSHDHGIEFPSPVADTVSLNVRIVPYSKKKRLLLATDVSQVHRLEQTRRDFVANASHELRTPLTVIAGYLETLSDSEDVCAERWQRPLRQMQRQSSRMLHIIDDLLMLSRLETQTEPRPHHPLDIPAMLNGLVEDAIAFSGERGHQIQLKADPNLWIHGCAQELRSAFSNLVFNAVRYTPDGGSIEIRWFTDERGIHLEVEDNGEGIPAQHLSRVTERFYRVNRDRSRESGGTGLGLAIVKHVVNNHNGKLNITSLVGMGSIFACDFPSEQRATHTLADAAMG